MLDGIVDDRPKRKPPKKRRKKRVKQTNASLNRKRRARENPKKNPVGRPTRDSIKREAKLIKLLPNSWKAIKKIGDGSFTAGIDLLLQEYEYRRLL